MFPQPLFFFFSFFWILSLTEPSAYPTTQQRSTRAPFQERVVVLARVALDRWLVWHFGEEVLIELDFEDFEVLHRGYIGWDEVPQLGPEYCERCIVHRLVFRLARLREFWELCGDPVAFWSFETRSQCC